MSEFSPSATYKRLLRIAGQRHVPDGAGVHGVRQDELFLDELPVLREHLKAIALSVADIYQVVFGDDEYKGPDPRRPKWKSRIKCSNVSWMISKK